MSVALGLGLGLATLIAYAPALHGGFVWDDDFHVTDNATLRTLDGLRRIWLEPGAVGQYYPLAHTTFWVEYHLWRLWSAGYHVVNVAIHAVNAILLWRLLKRLGVPGALLAGVVFALHPVHVESVAWITERRNVLSGLFYILATMAYLRFRPLEVRATEATSRWGWYALALTLFLCALLSKTVTCSFPAAVLLLRWWKRGSVERSDVVPLVPFFAMGLALSLMTVWLEKTVVGAAGTQWSLSLIERCLVAGRAVWFYAGKLLWPHPLTFVYPRWRIDPSAWWQYLFPAAALGVIATLWSVRTRLGRGPLAAVLFFGGTLVPALGFFDVYPMRYSFVADHFQYHASVGLIALGAAAATLGLARLASQVGRTGAALGVAAVLGWLTWRQAYVYESMRALWTDNLARNPASWMAHNNLGLLLFREGKPEEARRHFEESVQLNPGNAEAYNNLGAVLLAAGRADDAIARYEEALRVDPAYASPYTGLGNAYLLQGRLAEAIDQYGQALRHHASPAPTHLNWGLALASQGDLDGAISHYREALRLNPELAKAHYAWGLALTQQGKTQEAAGHFRAAADLDPKLDVTRRVSGRPRAD